MKNVIEKVKMYLATVIAIMAMYLGFMLMAMTFFSGLVRLSAFITNKIHRRTHDEDIKGYEKWMKFKVF